MKIDLHPFYSLVTDRAQGIDVSRYNKWFDPQQATQRIDFVFQKLTQGIAYVDLLLEEIWQGVAQVPVRGGYHYQEDDGSWQAQADHYLNIASRHDYHMNALDLESYGNVYSDRMFADTRRIIDYWRVEDPKPAILYTNGSTYELFAAAIRRQYSDADEWLAGLPFWYAWPSLIAPSPILPRGRNTWEFWQYRWDGPLVEWGNGIPCDVNYFNGSVADLQAFAQVTEVPPMPAEYVNGTANPGAGYTLRVRGGAGTTFPIVGSLTHGQSFDGWMENGWIKIDYLGKAGYIMASWTILAPATPPVTPAPGVVTVASMTFRADGTIDGTWADV